MEKPRDSAMGTLCRILMACEEELMSFASLSSLLENVRTIGIQSDRLDDTNYDSNARIPFHAFVYTSRVDLLGFMDSWRGFIVDSSSAAALFRPVGIFPFTSHDVSHVPACVACAAILKLKQDGGQRRCWRAILP